MTGATSALVAVVAIVVVVMIVRGLTKLALRLLVVAAVVLVAWGLADGRITLPAPG